MKRTTNLKGVERTGRSADDASEKGNLVYCTYHSTLFIWNTVCFDFGSADGQLAASVYLNTLDLWPAYGGQNTRG